ncbi:uncharacterized protein LOC104885159 isoform X2 [Beta vulgaris subsp. vulgaris]|uniref:uncharacterized protein LOC104885159 isoform X2 n=1 Tax=Beta vulgaris subsp. vulgaris TaxID=3555 RepID=UPI002548BDE1|nr:uncharacterized protein LOC104885159 isoform X2 [Beta vulgaris subsp. vulgaris]
MAAILARKSLLAIHSRQLRLSIIGFIFQGSQKEPMNAKFSLDGFEEVPELPLIVERISCELKILKSRLQYLIFQLLFIGSLKVLWLLQPTLQLCLVEDLSFGSRSNSSGGNRGIVERFSLFNFETKEIDHFENWIKVMEYDCKSITTAIHNIHKHEAIFNSFFLMAFGPWRREKSNREPDKDK